MLSCSVLSTIHIRPTILVVCTFTCLISNVHRICDMHINPIQKEPSDSRSYMYTIYITTQHTQRQRKPTSTSTTTIVNDTTITQQTLRLCISQRISFALQAYAFRCVFSVVRANSIKSTHKKAKNYKIKEKQEKHRGTPKKTFSCNNLP